MTCGSASMRTIFPHAPSSCALAGQMMVEPFFVWVMWVANSHLDLLLWLDGAYLLHLSQFAIWLKQRSKTTTVEECLGWSRHFRVFSMVTGMMLGFATLFFFPE